MRIRLITAALALVLFSAQAQALTLNEARSRGGSAKPSTAILNRCVRIKKPLSW